VGELLIVISMKAAEFAASAFAPSTPVPLPPPEPGVLVPGVRHPVIVVAGLVLCWAGVDCVCAMAVVPAATAMTPAKR